MEDKVAYDTSILGWMSEYDLIAIEQLSSMVPADGIIVEVGSLCGKSAIAMAMTNSTAKIYCIDVFPGQTRLNRLGTNYLGVGYPEPQSYHNINEIFDQNVKKFSNIVKIKGHSPRDIMNIDFGQIDMFFLDADHTNPNDWENIEHFLPMIKKGGIISGHDYLPDQFPDVVENVKRLEEILETKATFYKRSSMWSIIIGK